MSESYSYITVLTRDDSLRLGVDLTKGQETSLYGVGGQQPAYIHSLEVKIAFSTSNETPRLLGRKGIFDKFVICFDDTKKLVTFS